MSRRPSCPLCGLASSIEHLPYPIAGQGWYCHGCNSTFAATRDEWDNPANAKVRRARVERRRLAHEGDQGELVGAPMA